MPQNKICTRFLAKSFPTIPKTWPKYTWFQRSHHNKQTNQNKQSNLILEGHIGGCGNNVFWYCVISSILNKPNILIGSQSIVEDVLFPPLILKMNSCTFILQEKILCHSSTAKHPCRPLRVKVWISSPYFETSQFIHLMLKKCIL